MVKFVKMVKSQNSRPASLPVTNFALLLPIFFFLFPFYLNGYELRREPDSKIDSQKHSIKKKIFLIGEDIPFSGVIFNSNPPLNSGENSWRLEYEATFLNGEPNGTYKEFFKNGSIRVEQIVVHRELKITKQWHQCGQLASVEYYSNNQAHGVWKEWYPDGKLKSLQNFRHNRWDGKIKFWDENGQLKSDSTYRNGKLVRVYKFESNYSTQTQINQGNRN